MILHRGQRCSVGEVTRGEWQDNAIRATTRPSRNGVRRGVLWSTHGRDTALRSAIRKSRNSSLPLSSTCPTGLEGALPGTSEGLMARARRYGSSDGSEGPAIVSDREVASLNALECDSTLCLRRVVVVPGWRIRVIV